MTKLHVSAKIMLSSQFIVVLRENESEIIDTINVNNLRRSHKI